jgi:opacity protein-like surface antigen
MKNRQSFVALLGLLALCLLVALPAQAQRRSNTTGLFLNAHLSANSINYNFEDFDAFEDESDTGGGLGLQIGYGFSPLVTLYLGLNGASMDSDDVEDAYTLAHVDLGTQLNFQSGRSAAVPYGLIALSGRAVTFETNAGDITFSGGGVTLGGGLKYFLSPTFALDLGITGTFGPFTSIEAGGVSVEIDDINASSIRLGLGLSFFPSPRR